VNLTLLKTTPRDDRGAARPPGSFVSEPADAIRLRSNSAAPTASDAMAAVRNSAPGTGSFRCSSPLRSKGLNGQAPPPRRREYRESSPMRPACRLSILDLTLLFVTVALAAETREITREVRPRAERPTPLAPEETSSGQNVRLSSPRSNVDRSISGRDKAEREKTFAWLLRLLKERRGAR
jgi:hypothetical protein